jgi:hypothetical protein
MPLLAAARRIFAAFLAFAATAAFAANYSDIWWDPAEPGWGLTLADHEINLWAVWYTYRQDGSPTWMFVSGGTFDAGHTRFSGTLYQATGPSWRAAFTSRAVTVNPVGSVTLDFAPAGAAGGQATFTYTVGNVTATKKIERYPFGNAPSNWGRDATDLWWNPAESGWGIALTQHGSTLFGVWYTYDDTGQPLFVFMPAGIAGTGGQFAGDLFTAQGSWFGGPYDGSKAHTVPFAAGKLTLTAGAAVQGFTPQRGDWNAKLADGSVMDKLVTQIGFGNAAPSVAAPPCLANGTCMASDPSTAPALCSYRACRVVMDPYGYGTTCPCSSDPTLASIACTASRPAAADGASCNAGEGCAVGSVCATVATGVPAVCMREGDFLAAYCMGGY